MRVSTDETIERITKDFFKPIGRRLPANGVNSAEQNIDPLTKVYTCYQEDHLRKIEQRTTNKQS